MRVLLFVVTIIVFSFLDKQTVVEGIGRNHWNYELDPGKLF